MASKLGQSLDEILKDRKSRAPRGGRRGGKSTVKVPPTGGIKKNTTRPVAKNGKQVSARGAKPGPSGSVIQMSNLVSKTEPFDILLNLLLTLLSPETSPRPRSRYVIDEACKPLGTYVGTYLPSRIISALSILGLPNRGHLSHANACTGLA